MLPITQSDPPLDLSDHLDRSIKIRTYYFLTRNRYQELKESIKIEERWVIRRPISRSWATWCAWSYRPTFIQVACGRYQMIPCPVVVLELSLGPKVLRCQCSNRKWLWFSWPPSSSISFSVVLASRSSSLKCWYMYLLICQNTIHIRMHTMFLINMQCM